MGHIRHHLAIDLSEHFQSAPTGGRVLRRHWDRFPSRLERNVDHALRLLDRHDARATFFVDPWTAARHPGMVAEIAGRGHEIAARIGAEADAGSAVIELAQAARRVIHGWRPAPDMAPGRAPAGLDATSLRYTLTRSGADRRAVEAASGLSILPAGRYLATGECLRLLPEALAARVIRSWARARRPRVFSFKLWELDPETPQLAALSTTGRVRAYRNLGKFNHRLERLLGAVRFVPLRDRLGLAEEAAAPGAAAADCAPIELPREVERTPVSIVVPCYNEEPGLAYLANALGQLDAGFGSRYPLSFVIVDDGSTDATWAEMTRLFGDNPCFDLVRHPRNRGIGAAILTGILAAKDEIVAVIDSDCSYDPAQLEKMLPLLGPDVALVTASPYHALGGVEGVPEWRLFLSRGASWLYRSVLRNKLATYTSCFRVCRRDAVVRMALRHEGYIGVVEMLAQLDLQGWRIVEHPVLLETRLLGQSKLKITRVIAQHLRFLSEIVVTRLTTRGGRSALPGMRN